MLIVRIPLMARYAQYNIATVRCFFSRHDMTEILFHVALNTIIIIIIICISIMISM